MNEQVEHRLYALDAIRSWPEESRKPASWLIYVHQEPDHVSETELVWERVEPWLRIVATKEFEMRDWPFPHTVSVHSTARYHVPAEHADEIRELDFAVDVDVERGTVQALGPDLPTNLLMLNLVHDVVTGAKTPMEAHCRYTDLTTRPHDGPPPADMMKCRFADLETTEPAANPASGQSLASPPSVPNSEGGHTTMPSDPHPEPADPASELDTDHVSERTKTRERGDDADKAAERSSGFHLHDDDRDGR
jgi:hypothetical protein